MTTESGSLLSGGAILAVSPIPAGCRSGEATRSDDDFSSLLEQSLSLHAPWMHLSRPSQNNTNMMVYHTCELFFEKVQSA